MSLDLRHHPALAPYADFTFALTAPPPPSPTKSTPAVKYQVLIPSPSTVRSVDPDPKLYLSSFLLDHGSVTVSRSDLVRVLDLLLSRYAEAADLVAQVTKTMAEPLGKPDAAWCLEIHGAAEEVARRRLEMARTFNRELMRLADLERTGHPPRGWKTFSRPGKRAARKSRSVPSSVSEDETEIPEGSLSPLRRPSPAPRMREDNNTDWTGSMQCRGIHFVSEWVFRVARLIVAEGFPGVQEERDTHILENARAELAHLQHHMGNVNRTRSPPPPPPYPAPRSRTISLSRFRSSPSPSPTPPPEKQTKANSQMTDKDKASLYDYVRRLLVG
ncbi:hypothetical protein CcaverHIS002_0207430 [Cutaneotrichosporon cavernicola]|uniref:Uncharacterized protein n=1 Tax=Cutaneotrichosporon cavernicola TaxID=279322 RepID=A0AA48I1A7_9TREE|nr:uncharacterized protein CcaverHIS019_0207410 [Cutaneotrichosporon cavernicola]BEI81583.1 hypothetical protein CcaverHIS002_0207430 [Cutaneotrichosporon cavernicola]BEI89379.1 hypothetical protein CcaverHIS019_0207410 [Cutaneotrichosporon cavernicola]BEI97154.1 hypothetical protein CcaverHIS631_0207430 [Cutaneotrichosporon cavernicola]BEJ04927.1 hypothetical protein CcaverHIS641_0207440 [Cutaneotrichosporon cavernicola]